jgi:tetratricopeptide (TPR) repeat protein
VQLAELAEMAAKTPGRLIQLPWSVDTVDAKYVLSVRCSESSEDFVIKKATTSEATPEWTLIRRKDFSSAQIWNHTTGNLDLVLNLLNSEVHGVREAAQESAATPASSLNVEDKPNSERPTAAPYAMKLSSSVKEHRDSPELRNLVLGGNLGEVELPSILQSIRMCKMTGRLDCFQGLSQIEVFFDDGLPTHAIARGALPANESTTIVGDQVLLDLLTWETGTFHFNPVWTSTERTVKRRLEGLLLEGLTLRDYGTYLRKAGLDTNSSFGKIDENLSDKQLEETLKAGVPLDLSLQKEVYRLIEKGSTIEQILAKKPMTKAQWLPIMFNLFSCNLIAASSQSTVVSPKEENKRVEIDYRAVNAAARNLLKPETGLLTYPLFLHFLRQEMDRAKLTEHPFAVVVFDIKADGQPLPNAAVRQFAEAFTSKAERFDQIAHNRSFEEFIYLLPYKNAEAAYEFTSDFALWLLTNSLEGVKPNATLRLAFGIASIPEDCDTLPVLLATAAEAKQQSSGKDKVIFTFQKTKQSTERSWEKLREAGEVAVQQGDYNRAENIWYSALSEANYFAMNDRRLAYTVERLASVYTMQRKYSRAERLFERALLIKSEISDAPNMAVATSIEQLAECCYLQKKYSQAEVLIKRFIELCEKTLGQGHLSVANGLYNLATIYHSEQKYEQAEQAYKRGITIRQKILGMDHPDTKKLERNYASMLMSAGRISEAKTLIGNSKIEIISGCWAISAFDNEDHLTVG